MYPQRTRTRARTRRRRRRWPLFLLVFAVALCALGVSQLGFGQMHRLKTADLPAWVDQQIIPVNGAARRGETMKQVTDIAIHYVGNPGTTAQANRNYFASLADGAEGTYASSHFLVGLEGEVLQCVPLTEIAYASNIRNEDTVSIEVCHPDETGLFSDVTYARTVELTAWLCRTFDLDPETDVIRHYDVTGKICPRYYVEHPEAWEGFLADTAAELARQAEAEP